MRKQTVSSGAKTFLNKVAALSKRGISYYSYISSKYLIVQLNDSVDLTGVKFHDKKGNFYSVEL